MKKLLKLSSFAYEIIFAVAGALLVLAVAYFFGFSLPRDLFKGNDTANTLAFIVWINDHFLKVPWWYPNVGGGVSMMLGYPQAYSLAVVFLHRLSGLNLFNSMSVWNFLAIFVPAVSIFLYVDLKIKNKLGAILSAVFYLLIPLSYVLIVSWGFLANSFAVIFAVPILLFEDLFLDSVLENKSLRVRVLYLISLSVLFTLGLMAHPTVPIGMSITFAVYAVIYGVLHSGRDGLVKSILALMLMGAVCFSVSYFYNKPLVDYTHYAGRDLSVIKPGDNSTFPQVKLKGVLGLLGTQDGYDKVLVDISIPPAVWAFGIIGLITSIVFNKKRMIAVSGAAVFSIYQMGTFTLWNIFEHFSPFVADMLFMRYYFIPALVFTSIAAGVGASSIFGYPLEVLYKNVKNKTSKYVLVIPVGALYVAATLGIVLYTFNLLNKYNGSYNPKSPGIENYGMPGGFSTKFLWNRSGTDYCDKNSNHYSRLFCDNGEVTGKLEVSTFIYFCEIYSKYDLNNRPYYCTGNSKDGRSALTKSDVDEFINKCKKHDYDSPLFNNLCLSVYKKPIDQITNWPSWYLPDKALASDFEVKKILEDNSKYDYITAPGVRISISSLLGGWIREWPIDSKSYSLNSYTGQLILNKSFNSFYNEAIYVGTYKKFPEVWNNAAKYFGVSYVLTSSDDGIDKNSVNDWTEETIGSSRAQIWKPNFENSIYDLSNKPKVLVIGSSKNSAYQTIFKTSVIGGLSYDKAVMIEGKSDVDDYNSDELKKFDALVLYGYSYKNRNRGESLLREYLKNGGNVYIETGWQYISADYGRDDQKPLDLPDFMPVSKVYWGGVGANWDLGQGDSGFSPLVWNGTDWKVSYTDSGSVRSWSKALAWANNKVIAAEGTYGIGHIVWTGMNLPAHIMSTLSGNEVSLYAGIMDYLLPYQTEKGSYKFDINRTPDKLSVTLNEDVPANTLLYFKESFHPYWKSSFTIYSVGPRFMGVILPALKSGSKIELTFSPGFSLIWPYFISIGVILYFVFVLVTNKTGFKFKLQNKVNVGKMRDAILGKEDE